MFQHKRVDEYDEYSKEYIPCQLCTDFDDCYCQDGEGENNE